MRRFFRIAFDALTVLSLILAVGIAGLWVRSYWTEEYLARYSRAYDGSSLITDKATIHFGGVEFAHEVWGRGGDTKVEWQHSVYTIEKSYGRRGRGPLGFRWEREENPPLTVLNSVALLVIPLWLPLLICVALSAFCLRRQWAGRDGLCPSCGYDLRATPDRCPECGATAGSALMD